MSRILGILFGLVLGVVMSVSVSSMALGFVGVSETDGVYCEINEVKLFAANAEDCEKAGGTVTHTVSTEVKEVETVETEKE